MVTDWFAESVERSRREKARLVELERECEEACREFSQGWKRREPVLAGAQGFQGPPNWR